MSTREIIDLKSKDVAESQVSAYPQSIHPAVVLDNKAINTDQALIKDLSENSTKTNVTIPASSQLDRVRPFGSYMNPTTSYPNDVIRLDIKNAAQQYLETDYRISTYTKKSDKVTLYPEEDLARLSYISGRYRVEYKFHRNLLGSGDMHKMQIQEISADGLEMRLIPALSPTTDNTAFISFFESGFFTLPKAQTLVNLFLFKDANTSMRVFDYVQDKFTYDTTPYSIIFKLTSPVPTNVSVGNFLWLAQQVSEDLMDDITIVPPKYQPRTIPIAGPNFDIASKEKTQVSTQYKDWDDLLSTNTLTVNNIVGKLLSGSLIEGIPLNIDYRNFNNYVHFGSAQERLLNFKYKLELIQNYNTRINILADVDQTGTTWNTGSYVKSNMTDLSTRRDNLIANFDGYEKYLYYENNAYETSSYGEFYPTTWPKDGSGNNLDTTDVTAELWFEGIISSASLYDNNNEKALYKLIPEHVLEDESNEEYVLFTHMIGHYYDLIFSYIKQMTKVYDRNESLLEGFSKELVYHVAKNLGVDFENGNSLEELWNYVLGKDTGSLNTYTDNSAGYSSVYEVSTETKTKEIWKRIINNLPYLLKTKGTERGVRALINCFGIPSTILRVREYGGAEPYFDSKNDYVYERFNYSTRVGYTGQVETVDPSKRYNTHQLIRIPWKALNTKTETFGAYKYPSSIELRVKMAQDQSKEQRVMEVPNQWHIKAFKSGSDDYLGFFLKNSTTNIYATASVSCSIYDGDWHHICLSRNYTQTDDATALNIYTLSVRKTKYEKVVERVSASYSTSTAAYNNSFFATASNLWIPGSGSKTTLTSSAATVWSGSVQEFRYWSVPLQSSILDNHALAPTSFQGNLADTHTGSTSSFYDLYFRLCLGADNNKTNYDLGGGPIWYNNVTHSYSQHPNQSKGSFTGSLLSTSTASFYHFGGYSYQDNLPGIGITTLEVDYNEQRVFSPEVEIHSLEWPDLGGNRSISNKIRIEEVRNNGDGQLYRNNSVQDSLSDNQPIDSNRLGIYLSPTNEANQDIAEQLGGISIDDYIGDPSHLSLDEYPDLNYLYREYSKKYTSRNNAQSYIRLIRHFDSALFQMMKKFVPYRANTQVGLVIEPHLLHRSKIRMTEPSYTEEHYSSSLDLSQYYEKPGGFIEDGDGEPFRDGPYYVEAGTIGGDESDYITLSGQQQNVAEYNDVIVENNTTYQAPRQGIDVTPLVVEKTNYDMVVEDGSHIVEPITPSGTANEYNNDQISDNPSQQDSGYLYKTIDLAQSGYGRDTRVEGSQYVFMSYKTSGSGATRSEPYWYTSSRYDYHECLPPLLQTARLSEIYNNTNDVYDMDIYAGRAFRDKTVYSPTRDTSVTSTVFNNESKIYENNWTYVHGLRFQSVVQDNGTSLNMYDATYPLWDINSGGAVGLEGLTLTNYLSFGQGQTGSFIIPAFFYNASDPRTHNLRYSVSMDISVLDSTNTKITPYWGYLNGSLTGSTINLNSVGFTNTTVSYTTTANGPWLGLKMTQATPNSVDGKIAIRSLAVRCLNYRAEIQDFHLVNSYGMRNARYDGCKMTSTDWNVDSPDTVDRGPVVTITVGGGSQLTTNPGPRGNFQII